MDPVKPWHPANQTKLTPRETEIILLVSRGLSSQLVADEINVCKRTVDFHLNNIYDKLQVNNRVQAVNVARRLGFIA